MDTPILTMRIAKTFRGGGDMAFTDSNPVSIGNATKKAHYDLLFDNTIWLKANILEINTKAIFYKDTAPTGWTIQNTLNDKLLFITKGSAAGGQVGGGAHSTGVWVISGIVGGNHVLTESELPSHKHRLSKNVSSGSYMTAAQYMAKSSNYGAVGESYILAGSGSIPDFGWVGAAGSGTAHNHGNSGHTGLWRPAAYCAIIAQKN